MKDFKLGEYVVLLGRIDSITQREKDSPYYYGVYLEGEMPFINHSLIKERAIIRIAEPRDFEDSGFNIEEKKIDKVTNETQPV